MAELQTLLTESREQLQQLRFKVAADQHKNVRDVRSLRKTIARVLQVLRHKPDVKTVKP